MAHELTVDPALYARCVRECLEAFSMGRKDEASVLAMTAGVDAGVLGLDLSECPFAQPDCSVKNLELQWKWGHSAARTVNDNREQGRLL